MKQELAERVEAEARQNRLLGNDAKAKELFTELERIHDAGGFSADARALNLNRIAFLAAKIGSTTEAVRAARKCLELYNTVPAKHAATLTTYTAMLSYVLAEAGNFDEAIHYGEEGLAMFVQQLGEENEYVQYRARDLERMKRHESGDYLDKEKLSHQ